MSQLKAVRGAILIDVDEAATIRGAAAELIAEVMAGVRQPARRRGPAAGPRLGSRRPGAGRSHDSEE